jgi:hypothetical protein
MDDTLHVFLEKLANIGQHADARETARPSVGRHDVSLRVCDATNW